MSDYMKWALIEFLRWVPTGLRMGRQRHLRPDENEDVIQQVSVGYFRKVAFGEPICCPHAFLTQAFKNAAVNYFRERRTDRLQSDVVDRSKNDFDRLASIEYAKWAARQILEIAPPAERAAGEAFLAAGGSHKGAVNLLLAQAGVENPSLRQFAKRMKAYLVAFCRLAGRARGVFPDFGV